MLSVRGVSKRYGSQAALTGSMFELAGGEVLAVIGPNGAGKTTLIKCVVGLVRFEGAISVDGIDVARRAREARRRIGYLPQNPAFHPDLTVAETALFYADLNRVPAAAAVDLVERVGLAGEEAKLVGALSGGMRQRLALAIALLGDPPLVVLDEPVAGLDITARLDLRRLVQEQRATGKAVLLSTHWLEDVPYVADNAMVLDAGRTVFYGPARDLARSAAPVSKLFLRLNGTRQDAGAVIEELAGGSVTTSGDWLVVPCRAIDKARIVERLVAAGVGVLDFRVEEDQLDGSVFGAREAQEASDA